MVRTLLSILVLSVFSVPSASKPRQSSLRVQAAEVDCEFNTIILRGRFRHPESLVVHLDLGDPSGPMELPTLGASMDNMIVVSLPRGCEPQGTYRLTVGRRPRQSYWRGAKLHSPPRHEPPVQFFSVLDITLGAVGPEGPQGPTGSQGPEGPTGPQGEKGDPGDEGPVGPTGPQGEVGPAGATGPAGRDGAMGARGATGPTGPSGPTGPQGLQGNPGPPGTPGAPGSDGATWLSGAVDPPNTLGNEGDFYLNTTTGDIFQRDPLSWTQVGNLTGPQGFPGPAGPPGEAGGSDRRDQLAGLLGVDPKRISVPLPAVRPADCSSGGALTLNVNGGPLGQVIGLLGHDAISSPFTFLVAVRAAPGLSRTAFLDANAILSITAAGSSTVRGIVSAFDLAGVDDGNGLYVATVQPTFVRADRTAEFGTFSNSKVSDIVVQVLGSEGISVGVPSTDVQLEYEVRLAETALAFAGRLMEREGLHYHVSDTGSMIVGDGNAVFPGGPELKYLGHFAVSGPGEARLSSFRSGGSIVPEDATVVSWNSFAKQAILADFTFPADDSAFGAGSVLGLALEVETVDEGQSRAAALLGREQVRKSERLGTSNAPGVRAGRNILVTDTVGAGFAGSYVVTEVTHVAIPSQDGACFDYGNAFTAISEDVPFRPPRRTPQPRIGGLISAVVTNTGDPEALARIKVKFPWSSPDNSESRWVRFIQLASLRDPMFPMAPVPPSNFPEIDDEVLVGFIGGDPRRPVALGYLYNGVNRPPEDP